MKAPHLRAIGNYSQNCVVCSFAISLVKCKGLLYFVFRCIGRSFVSPLLVSFILTPQFYPLLCPCICISVTNPAELLQFVKWNVWSKRQTHILRPNYWNKCRTFSCTNCWIPSQITTQSENILYAAAAVALPVLGPQTLLRALFQSDHTK